MSTACRSVPIMPQLMACLSFLFCPCPSPSLTSTAACPPAPPQEGVTITRNSPIVITVSSIPIFFYDSPGKRQETADGPSLGLSGLNVGLYLWRIKVNRRTSWQQEAAGSKSQGESAVAYKRSLPFGATRRFSFISQQRTPRSSWLTSVGAFLPRGPGSVWTLPWPLGSCPEKGILFVQFILELSCPCPASTKGPVCPGGTLMR